MRTKVKRRSGSTSTVGTPPGLRTISTSGGLDPRPGHEHLRADPTDQARGPPVGDLHRGDAVRVVAGTGGKPLPCLALHHDEHPIDGGDPVEQIADQRGGDVVRQVGHQDPPWSSGRERFPVELASVTGDHRRGGLGEDLSQGGEQVTIELDRGHRRAGLDERQGQGAEPGADLDHVVTRSDRGEARDAADGVGVGDEVLAERSAGAEPVPVEQVGELPTGVGHDARSPMGMATR